MSRGAVRTALIRLEQDGLVVREPHRGARVRRVSDEEAVEILQARAVLEGLAVRQAAERIDDAGAARLHACLARQRELLEPGDLLGASDANAELHATLLELSGHATAVRLIQSLNAQTVRYQYRTILIPGRPAASVAEHAAIVEAVVAGVRTRPSARCETPVQRRRRRAARTAPGRHRQGESRRPLVIGVSKTCSATAGNPVELLRNAQTGPNVYPGVPPEFTNWRDEQRAWQETCVLFNLSFHMNDLAVEGPDALEAALATSRSTASTDSAGDRAKHFVPCSPDGYVIGDVILFARGENRFNLVGRAPALNWIIYHAETGSYDVTVELDLRTALRTDGRRRSYRFQLQGPTAMQVIEKALGDAPPELRFFHTTTVTIAGRTVGPCGTAWSASRAGSSSGPGRTGRRSRGARDGR